MALPLRLDRLAVLAPALEEADGAEDLGREVKIWGARCGQVSSYVAT